VFDSNEITPSKLLGNNIKIKEKFSVVLVHFSHKIIPVRHMIIMMTLRLSHTCFHDDYIIILHDTVYFFLVGEDLYVSDSYIERSSSIAQFPNGF
jgi:hypothetical protein